MSCNRVFAIGDTHFGHKKIAAIRGYASVQEHDRDLVERWNALVSPKDTVWHLGDVWFGGADAGGVVSSLNGLKRLVLGNHDSYPIDRYLAHFGRVFGAIEYRGAILTHIPVAESQFERYRLNIHGHLHQAKMEDSRYRNVSYEQHLGPVLMDTVML